MLTLFDAAASDTGFRTPAYGTSCEHFTITQVDIQSAAYNITDQSRVALARSEV